MPKLIYTPKALDDLQEIKNMLQGSLVEIRQRLASGKLHQLFVNWKYFRKRVYVWKI